MVRQVRESGIPPRELFEKNPVPMWVYDLETLAFLAVNAAAVRHYGYSRRKFLAMTIKEIRPPEEIPALLEKVSQPAEGHDAAGTWRHRKKDGTIIDVEITTHQIRFGGRKAKLVLANDITERQRLEQGLSASAEEWRRTFDAISDAVALIDQDGTILRCNKAMAIIVGKDYHEIVGRRCWEVVHGTSERIHGCPVHEMMTTLQRTTATVRSGARIYKIVADPIFDTSGQLIGAVHIMSDLTGQEQAEKILHDVVLQQKAILDNVPDIAWLKDDQGRFLAVNEPFGMACGSAPAALVGKTDLDIWPRELAERYRADDAEVMRSRARKVVEEPLADKAGLTTWIETIKTPIIDGKGNVVGTAGIARDITARRQSETALKASEDKFRTLFDTANDAIFIVDFKGNFIDANSVAYERLGYSREEFLSKNVAEIDLPEFAARVPERIRTIRECGKASFETAHFRKDGTVMPVEINARVIDFEGRKALYSIVRDITERKKTEVEIQAANALLDAINRVQSQVIVEALPAAVFETLLKSFLGLTLSQYGFIGEILCGVSGPPFLRTHAITNIAWDEATRALYAQHAPHFEFANLKTLFGAVVTSGKPVIANDPAADPRRGGLPPGHPALDSFLGLPLYHNDTLIGMVGIANRPGGYDEKLVAYLQPLLSTCGGIIAAYRNEARRKQAEEAIAESETRYRDLFENASDAIFLLDSRQRYFDANLKAEELTGYTRDELKTMGVLDLVPPDQAATSAAEFKKLETQGSYERFEGRIRRKDGGYSDVEVSSSAIVKEGTVVGSRYFVRDVTERKKLQEDVYRISRDWEETFNTLTDMVTVHDKDFNIIRANWAAEKILGLHFLEVKNAKCFEYFHGTACPPAGCPSCASLVTGQPSVNEIYEPHLGRHLEIRAIPRLDSNNQVVGLIHVVRDISERKRNEKSLERYDRDLAALNTASNTLMLITSLDGIYQEICNIIFSVFDVKLVWFGVVEEGDCAIRPVAQAGRDDGYLGEIRVRWDDSPLGMGPAGMAVKTKTAVKAKIDDPSFAPWREAAEKRGYLAVMAVPLIQTHGECVGVLTFYSADPDYFTPDKERLCRIFANQSAIAVENVLLIAKLEEKVFARTFELESTNVELHHVNQELELRRLEAESASRTKSDFLANMSHELRTPLNAIIGFSDIMVRGMAGPLAEKQKEYLGDILAGGKHLLSLINDILDLSRVEAGKMEIEPAEYDAAELINSCLVLFREKASKHRLDLRMEIEGAIEPILGDERKIRQVLYNLLSNAVKFTPDGGSVIVRAKTAHEDGGDYAEIAVSDSGIGISPTDQERLFQPFQQLSHYLTKEHEGTGLGLALCKSFVEMHGGGIRVESAPGQGSTFTFRIPVRYEKGLL